MIFDHLMLYGISFRYIYVSYIYVCMLDISYIDVSDIDLSLKKVKIARLSPCFHTKK